MDISGIKIIEHDVIVLGAGGAGLRAAIECSNEGLVPLWFVNLYLGKPIQLWLKGALQQHLEM